MSCSETGSTTAGGQGGASGGGAGATTTGGAAGSSGAGGSLGATVSTAGPGGAGGTVDSGSASSGGSGGIGDGGHPSADGGPAAAAGPGVLTRGYDLKRTGANLSEKTLNPGNVNPAGFGKHYCAPVDGQIYSQILYVPRVDMGAKGTHDIVYVATMNDSVYAFDALQNLGSSLWERHYADPANGIVPVPRTDVGKGAGCPANLGGYNDIQSGVGIVSTPAVDVMNRTMYFVTRTKEGTRYVQRLHAVGLVDGAELAGSPVEITATYPGTGEASVGGTITFDPRTQNQRAALLLLNGTVFIGWAAHCDESPFHGWILGYDAKTLQRTIVYMTTPSGVRGGIWMAGMGPAVDDDGTIFLSTGNGRNTAAPLPATDLSFKGGHTVLRLRPMGNTFDVVDWFTPSSFALLESADVDLGGSGTVIVPDTRMVLAAGKDGKIYLLDKGNLGHETSNDRQAIQVLQVTPPLPNGLAPHIHGTPVLWSSPTAKYLYVMGEEDPLHQYVFSGDRLMLYKTTAIRAPVDPDRPYPWTMPGGILAVSADGANPESAILWLNMTISGDANQKTVAGVLRALRADDVSAPELWNSQQNAARDSYGNFAKFNSPTVYNGRVYVPTFSNQYCVYGLL